MSNNAIKLEMREETLIYNINGKLNQTQLTVTKADKGNTFVILHERECNRTEEFFTQNKITELSQNITLKQQKSIRKCINNSSSTTDKNEERKHININPSAPRIHGTIKLHRHLNQPVP
jgi:hypothetical protein